MKIFKLWRDSGQSSGKHIENKETKRNYFQKPRKLNNPERGELEKATIEEASTNIANTRKEEKFQGNIEETIRQIVKQEVPEVVDTALQKVTTDRRIKSKLKKLLDVALKHWIISSCVLVLFLALPLEIPIAFKVFDLWDIFWTKPLSLLSLPSLSLILGGLWKIYGPKRTAHPTETESSPETEGGKKENPLQCVVHFFRNFWNDSFGNLFLKSLVYISVIVLLGSSIAHTRFWGHIFVGANSASTAITQFFDEMTNLEEDEESPVSTKGEGNEPSSDESLLDIPKDEELESAVPSQPINEPEPEEPEPEEPEPEEPEPIFLLLNSDYEADFTEEDNDRLFFLSGSYEVTDWTSGEAVANCLLPYIKSLRNQQLPNNFDANSEGDERIRGRVAKASRDEAIMTNSAQLDDIISARKDAWDVGERFDLAKLLANNMQTYAKAYLNNQGLYQTVKYYYAESIRWSLESLRFASVTSKQEKAILEYISTRYKDIAFKAPKNSNDAHYAILLKEAFAILPDLIAKSEEFEPCDEQDFDFMPDQDLPMEIPRKPTLDEPIEESQTQQGESNHAETFERFSTD